MPTPETEANQSVLVNGRAHNVPAGVTVAGLLRHLSIEPDRVAVELNRAIIRRADWDLTPVEDGAELEIVQFVGGG